MDTPHPMDTTPAQPSSSSGAATRTRQDPRGASRRRKIFRALHDCVLAQGYYRTTLAEIAKAADMRPSHLLYYFNGKEDILEQYFQVVAESFVTRLASFEDAEHEERILLLADFWFRGETSTVEEIGFMLECFGAAVHDAELRQTKTEFDRYCKAHLVKLFTNAPANRSLRQRRDKVAQDHAEICYSMMIGLRSAVYFDANLALADAYQLFLTNVRNMCGYPA